MAIVMVTRKRAATYGKAHSFGGDWTSTKLDILGRYLSGYTTVLKARPFVKAYIDAFAGTGFDYALGLRDGLFAQARLRTGTIGVGNARVHTTATPPQPDRTLKVKPGVPLGVRIYVGYLHVF